MGRIGATLVVGTLVTLLVGVGGAGSANGIDVTPVVSVGSSTIVQGESGAPRKLRIPITLSVPSTTEITVSATLTPNNAKPGVDYVPWKNSRLVRFKPNVNTGLTPIVKYITITVLANSAVDAGGNVNVSLSNPTGALLGQAAGYGAISPQDDDPRNNASLAQVTVAEGDLGTRKIQVGIALDHATATSEQVAVSINLYFGPIVYSVMSKTGTKTVTFKPGQVQRKLTIIYEPNDFGPVSFQSAGLGLVALTPGVAAGTPIQAFLVQDDDPAGS